MASLEGLFFPLIELSHCFKTLNGLVTPWLLSSVCLSPTPEVLIFLTSHFPEKSLSQPLLMESTPCSVSKQLPSLSPRESLLFPSVLLSHTIFFLALPSLVWVLFCTRDWGSNFSQELHHGANISCSGKPIYCVFWELVPDGWKDWNHSSLMVIGTSR